MSTQAGAITYSTREDIAAFAAEAVCRREIERYRRIESAVRRVYPFMWALGPDGSPARRIWCKDDQRIIRLPRVVQAIRDEYRKLCGVAT